MWLYSRVCVGPGQKPQRQRYSHDNAQFIHLADGRKRNPAQKEAYNKAWELLTTTDVDTLLTQHAVITQEDLKTRDVADIIVKGMLQQLTTLVISLSFRTDRPEQTCRTRLYILMEPCHEETFASGFLSRSDTNPPEQP